VSPRTKKLIGTFGLLIWVGVYAMLVMRFAVDILPQAGGLVTLVFYAVSGTLWIVPAGLLLPWMHRDSRKGRPRG